MKRITSLFALLSLAVLVASTAAEAATVGTANVTLAASANTMIQVLDPTLTLTPTSTDYDNDYVEAAGAAGLRVRVKTNSSTGMQLFVKCADATPQIALADLTLRTQTAAGSGGTTMAAYTAVTAANQTLWTSGVAQHAWVNVTSDIRINNLIAYDDAITAGTTNYTNTLTYTVVSQ